MGGALRLEGRVLDDARRPVAGARVWLDSGPVLTDATGAFVFEQLSARSYRLTAHHDDATAEVMVTPRIGREPINLRLRAGSTLRVRVVANDAPLAGASLALDGRIFAVSDGDGLAMIGGLRRHSELVVSSDGFAPATMSVDSIDDPVVPIERTVTLLRGAPIEGVVVGPDGGPAGRAVIAIGTDVFPAIRIETDSHGRWRCAVLAAGVYRVRVESSPHHAHPEIIVDHDGITPKSDLILRFPPGARLVGIARDALGMPIPETIVVATMHRSDERIKAVARAGADGRFELHDLAPGGYVVFARNAERASGEAHVALVEGERAEIDLVLEAARLTGTVVDANGHPVADVSVQSHRGADVTDSHGRFDLGGLPPGAHHVHAIWDDPARGLEVRARLRTEDPTARLVLPEPGTLTGRVMFEGRSLTHFGIVATLLMPGYTNYGPPITVRAPDGRFTLRGLAAGTWRLQLAGAGTAVRMIMEIDVVARRTVDLGDVALKRGQRITGVVMNPAGEPVSGARVSLGRDEMYGLPTEAVQRWFSRSFETETDAQGRFEFDGVTSGPIAASHPVHGASLSMWPDGDADLQVHLREVGAIEGVIEGCLGIDATLGVTAYRCDDRSDSRWASLDPAGAFRFESLPPGDYLVELDARPGTQVTMTVVAKQRVAMTLVLEK